MKLKSKLFGLLSVSAATSIGGVAVTSLTESIKQNALLNGNNKDDNNDNDNNVENNTPSNIVELSSSKTSTDIVNGAPSINKDLSVIKANNNNKVQNKEYYLNNTFNVKTYEQIVSANGLKKDLMFYLNSLWKTNGKKIAMSFVTEPVVRVSQDYSKNVFVHVKVKLLNLLPTITTFKFNDFSFDIDPNGSRYFEIVINNVPFNLAINSFNNRFFLGVKFNSILFNCYDSNDIKVKSYMLDNFSFTPKNFSYIFLNEFSGLTNQLNYRQIYDDQTFNLYRENLTNKEIENNIVEFANQQQRIIMASLRAADNIFLSLSNDPTLQEFLQESGESISYLLTELKVIPQELQGLVTDLVKNNKTVIEVIQSNRETIEKFALSILGNDPFFSGLITNVLDKIKPNMTEQEKNEFFSLLEIIPGDIGFIKSILGKIFDNVKTFEIVFDLLMNSTDQIKQLINGAPFVTEILDFLKEVFIKYQGNPRILTVFSRDKSAVIKLLDTFLSSSGMALPETFWFYFDQLFTENSNFNVWRLQSLFKTTFVGFTSYFLSSVQTSGSFVRNVTYDKKNNTISFKYDYIWTFTRDYTWSVLPLKEILPNYIGIQGFPFKIPSKWVTDVLFDYIQFTKNDRVVFTYEANNQQLWAKPQLENDLYYFGYSIPHKLKIWLDWPGGYNSIAWQFHWFAGQWNAASDITYYALAQQHEILQNMSFYDKNKVLGDYQYYGDDVYIDNLSFKWNPLTDDLKYDTWGSLTRDTLRRYDVYTADLTNKHQYIWSTALKVADDKVNHLINRYISVSDKIKNDSKLKPVVHLHPIVDLKLRYLSSQILSVFAFEVVVMFPHEVLNTQTGEVGNTFRISFNI